jgi:tyrosine-protein kinase Etk/Wzc
VRTADDLERRTGLRARATIPESAQQHALMGRRWFTRRQPRLLALKAPAEPAVESLRSLRTSMALQQAHMGCATVLITAATAHVGKSFVAANLAALAAAGGRRVLLMDLDLRMPRLQAYLGLERHREGVSDVLEQRCELEQALVRDVVPGLDVLLSGARSDNPGELLLSGAFPCLLAQVEALYDDVIIDSAPVLPVGDTLAIARQVHTTLLVVRSEQSSVRVVRDAVLRLEGAGVAVDGVILNAVKRGRLATVPYHSYFRSYAHAAR